MWKFRQLSSHSTSQNLKYFSRHTHTIYAPKLEVRWDDHTYDYTGTFDEYDEEFDEASGYFNDPEISNNNVLTMSGDHETVIFIKGLQKTYRETEKVRFRLGCRKKYEQKTFTNSMLTSSFHVPKGSGSYSIVDVGTNTPIVPLVIILY